MIDENHTDRFRIGTQHPLAHAELRHQRKALLYAEIDSEFSDCMQVCEPYMSSPVPYFLDGTACILCLDNSQS